MSAEESQASSDNASGDEQLSDHEQRKLVCRPLPWRSAKAKKVLAALDKKYKRRQSEKGRLMTVPRVVGPPSTRKQQKLDIPEWALDFWDQEDFN